MSRPGARWWPRRCVGGCFSEAAALRAAGVGVPRSCTRPRASWLDNVVRHARALNLSVGLHQVKGQVVLEIADDGIGMDLSSVNEQLRAGHIGLVSQRARIESAGGELKFPPTRRGTLAHVALPAPAPAPVPVAGARHEAGRGPGPQPPGPQAPTARHPPRPTAGPGVGLGRSR